MEKGRQKKILDKNEDTRLPGLESQQYHSMTFSKSYNSLCPSPLICKMERLVITTISQAS